MTRDGVAVSLLLNAGLLLDVAQLSATGAEGVGLFRTEIPLLTRDAFPDVADQTEFYRRAYEQADGRPIVFRTLDIGGDKMLPYLPHAAEDNPAMGWRAIRIGLDRPAMLRQQLRALVRAAAGQRAAGQVSDDRRGRRARCRPAPCSTSEIARAAGEKRVLPRSVKVGVMLEVPSLLWQLPALVRAHRLSCRSAPTTWRSSFLPATAATPASPTATTCCRRRCSPCSAA